MHICHVTIQNFNDDLRDIVHSLLKAQSKKGFSLCFAKQKASLSAYDLQKLKRKLEISAFWFYIQIEITL